MRRLVALAAVTVAAVIAAVLVGTSGDPGDPGPGVGPSDGPEIVAAGAGLVGFDACDALVEHLQASATVDPWSAMRGGVVEEDMAVGDGAADAGAAAPSAAPAATDVSDTNVQVAGVDEPDLVETDGRRLFTAVDGNLRVVDVSGPSPRLLAERPLGPDQGRGGEAQLLLHDDRLLALTASWGGDVRPMLDAPDALMPAPGSPVTSLQLFDVAADEPRLVAEAEIEGAMVAGRGIDGTVHLVLQHRPQPVPADAMEPVWRAEDDKAARQALQQVLAATTATDWLPTMRHVDAAGVVTTAPAVDCTSVRRTGEVADTTMLEVLTFDMAADGLAPRGSAAVLTSASIVTADAEELVVATPVWPRPDVPMPVEPGIMVEDAPADAAPPAADGVAPEPQRMTTRLHLFGLSQDGAAYQASGEIDGQVLNQFSMSLHDGYLRVASTVGEIWGGAASESGVTVLERRGDRLETVGAVGDLGHGERIYAVRFLGDTAYVVTFRQVDPLYTIDLSDPAAPVETGDLKITGYSAYLHPLPQERLLGVGQEATEEGRTLGTQVSLFDVSGAQAVRASQVILPNSGTEAEYDHHAFLYHDGTLVVPYERWTNEPTVDAPQGYETGAMIVEVDGAALSLRGTVSQQAGAPDPWASAIRRAVIVDGTLWTVSRAAVEAIDLATLTPTGQVRW